MKTVNRFSVLLIVLFISTFYVSTPAVSQNFSVNFQVFYDNLSPYGDWVYDQNYGYVWVPDVEPGFMPYATNGHWIYTDFGWTWVSDYPWGWAPFHYGRWYFNPAYGPIWVPGHEWGPAWVCWRHANGYYGWAPLGPDISMNVAFSNTYDIPYDHWVFVRDRNLYRPDIHRYYVNRQENVTIINNSTIINNTYVDNSRHETYISGPDRREIQRETGRNIRPVRVRDVNTPGTKVTRDQVMLYRPRVESRSGDNRRAAPSNVKTYSDVRPVAERKMSNDKMYRTGNQVKNQIQERTDRQQNRNLNQNGDQRATQERINQRQNQEVRQQNQRQQTDPQQLEARKQNQRQQTERQQLEMKQQNQRQQQIQNENMRKQENVAPKQQVQPQQRQQQVQPQRQQQVQPQPAPSKKEIRQQQRFEKQEMRKQTSAPQESHNRK